MVRVCAESACSHVAEPYAFPFFGCDVGSVHDRDRLIFLVDYPPDFASFTDISVITFSAFVFDELLVSLFALSRRDLFYVLFSEELFCFRRLDEFFIKVSYVRVAESAFLDAWLKRGLEGVIIIFLGDDLIGGHVFHEFFKEVIIPSFEGAFRQSGRGRFENCRAAPRIITVFRGSVTVIIVQEGLAGVWVLLITDRGRDVLVHVLRHLMPRIPHTSGVPWWHYYKFLTVPDGLYPPRALRGGGGGVR